VAALLASPGLDVLVQTDRHQAVAERVFAEVQDLGGNLMHDAHTAVLMREHGVRRIVTRDRTFTGSRFSRRRTRLPENARLRCVDRFPRSG